MPTVVNTETSAARNRTSSITRSRISARAGRARRSPRGAAPISVVVAGHGGHENGSAILWKQKPARGAFRERARSG